MSYYLDEIDYFMNYTKIFSEVDRDKQIFVVTDHRAVIPIIWAAIKDKLFSQPPLLIRFDAHFDMASINQLDSYENKNIDITEYQDIKEVHNFANFKSRTNDGSWITDILIYNLVGDIATYYLQEKIRGRDKSYCNFSKEGHYCERNIDNINHRIINFSKISKFIHSLRSPYDEELEPNKQKIIDAMSIDIKHQPKIHLLNNNSRDIWFDIDLDFATHCLSQPSVARPATTPWRKKDFLNEFIFYQDGCVGHFVKQVIKESKLITISTEPTFSGGYRGIYKILKNLNLIFCDDFDLFENILINK